MNATSPGISLPILNWIDGPIKQSFENVFKGMNTSAESFDIFNRFRDTHFKNLHEKISNVQVLGMSEPTPLMQIYSPHYLSTTIHRRLYEQEIHKPNEKPATSIRKGNRVCADVFMEKHNRVALLGAAGSGKTTLLRYLALAYSNKTIFDSSKLETPKIPFYISLLEYSRQNKFESIFDYIFNELEKDTNKYAFNYLKRLFEKGMAVVLLDSIDEVSISKRNNLFIQIKEFCRSFSDCKIILSCRTADYTHTFENFYEAEIAKLTQSAVEKVINGWFKNDKQKAILLLKHIQQDVGIKSLTETPLLLSLVCIQFRHDLTLPKRKVELYQRCTEALLREWDTTRDFRRDTAYSSLSDDRKERIFEYVAGANFLNGIKYTFPENQVHKQIAECCEWFGIEKQECKGVLKEIEQHHGIIERFSMDSYTFSHQSFQEYFAARYFLAKRIDFEIVKKHIDHKQWFAVIEFLVSIHPNPEDILKFIATQSDMKGIKNQYPAMELRTRRLWLLFRCLSVVPMLPLKSRIELYEYILNSQIDIASIYGKGGVFPVAILMKDGVRHAYFYTKKERSTLQSALQPLRWLANEMLSSPSAIYSEIAMKGICKLELLKQPSNSKTALLMCLILPLASQIPGEALCTLDDILDIEKEGAFKQMVKESKEILINNYL